MRVSWIPVSVLALAATVALTARAGDAPPAPSDIRITGAVAAPRDWTVASLREHFAGDIREFEYRQKDSAHKAHGIPLIRLVLDAKPRFDPEHKHHDLAFAVVARSPDGYAAAFSFGELDGALGKAEVWVALDRDGGALSEKHGPLELIAVSDGKASRWVRAVCGLDVHDLSAATKAPASEPAAPSRPSPEAGR